MTSPRFGTRPARVEDQAAQRIDLLLVAGLAQADRRGAPRAPRSGCARRRSSVPSARSIRCGRLGLVVLVLDLADDLLDQVLDGHQPVDAAELVDHHRHVDARLAHLHQQIEDRHRRRARTAALRSSRRGEPASPSLGDRGQHVLDVDEADHVVERLAIDRQARVAAARSCSDDLGERRSRRRAPRCRRAAPSRRRRLVVAA